MRQMTVSGFRGQESARIRIHRRPQIATSSSTWEISTPGIQAEDLRKRLRGPAWVISTFSESPVPFMWSIFRWCIITGFIRETGARRITPQRRALTLNMRITPYTAARNRTAVHRFASVSFRVRIRFKLKHRTIIWIWPTAVIITDIIWMLCRSTAQLRPSIRIRKK